MGHPNEGKVKKPTARGGRTQPNLVTVAPMASLELQLDGRGEVICVVGLGVPLTFGSAPLTSVSGVERKIEHVSTMLFAIQS